VLIISIWSLIFISNKIMKEMRKFTIRWILIENEKRKNLSAYLLHWVLKLETLFTVQNTNPRIKAKLLWERIEIFIVRNKTVCLSTNEIVIIQSNKIHIHSVQDYIQRKKFRTKWIIICIIINFLVFIDRKPSNLWLEPKSEKTNTKRKFMWF